MRRPGVLLVLCDDSTPELVFVQEEDMPETALPM